MLSLATSRRGCSPQLNERYSSLCCITSAIFFLKGYSHRGRWEGNLNCRDSVKGTFSRAGAECSALRLPAALHHMTQQSSYVTREQAYCTPPANPEIHSVAAGL